MQQLYVAASCLDVANAVSQRAAWVLMLRSLIYSVSNAYRWAAGAEYPAHMFWRQVGCLQRMGYCAAAFRCGVMLGCKCSLGVGAAAAECRLRDAVSTHVAPRNGGAPVLGAAGAHEASQTPSSSLALWHHSQMQANAVSQRAAWVQLIAAGANLRRERCCTGARCAQKWWRICIGGRWVVCSEYHTQVSPRAGIMLGTLLNAVVGSSAGR